MIEKIIRFLISFEKYNNPILMVIIILLRLPPLVFPGLDYALLNTHSIARYLLLLLLITLIIKKKIIPKNGLLFFSLLLLVVKSISIVTAVSISGFFLIYKDFLFGIIFLFVALNVITNKDQVNRVIKTLILTLFINLVFQSFSYFWSGLYIKNISNFLYSKYFENFLIHFNRGRYFVDVFDISLLPILVLFVREEKNYLKRIIFSILITVSLFYSLVSGFRNQLIVGFLSLALTFFFIKETRKIILSIFLILLLVITIFNYKYVPKLNFLTLDRLNFSKKESISPIMTRLFFWQRALLMGLSSPIIGVGLGNYYDYYSPKPIILSASDILKNKLFEVTAFHPHNIFFAYFAETGLLGLIILLLFLLFLIKNDLKYFSQSIFHKIIVISFWSLFLFSLITPDNIIQYIILFWLLRVLIEKAKFIINL